MARTPKDITDAELAVIKQLWESGRTTVRKIADTLYPGGTNVHYATVQKLLERLENKNYVKRDRKLWPHEFVATVSCDEVVGQKIKMVADKFCNGSFSPLLTHLVKTKITPAQAKSLRELLDDLEKEKGR